MYPIVPGSCALLPSVGLWCMARRTCSPPLTLTAAGSVCGVYRPEGHGKRAGKRLVVPGTLPPFCVGKILCICPLTLGFTFWCCGGN